ncbi:unnamed protein product [Peronospora belbahrii]|uniref:Uncharacterized protein n=1 Tax=Peronospora belbahrii TaxID=622444 RepID=A0AAU9LII0_9STRA|nr:unnamed protein product [Peronospora belbahrii]
MNNDLTTHEYARMNVSPRANHHLQLHPLALTVGVLGLFLLFFLVTASSYQKQKLQILARKMLWKKRKSMMEEEEDRGGPYIEWWKEE